jgi:DNA-binding transcriptional MerR regulator
MPAAPSASKTYTIADLADEFDITARAIRHYEEEGLISPRRVGASAGARRFYSARERVRVMLILRGKRLGMSLHEIKELFDLYDADKTERAQLHKFIEMLDHRRTILEQQRIDIADALAEVNEVTQQCKRILSARKLAQK